MTSTVLKGSIRLCKAHLAESAPKGLGLKVLMSHVVPHRPARGGDTADAALAPGSLPEAARLAEFDQGDLEIAIREKCLSDVYTLHIFRMLLGIVSCVYPYCTLLLLELSKP